MQLVCDGEVSEGAGLLVPLAGGEELPHLSSLLAGGVSRAEVGSQWGCEGLDRWRGSGWEGGGKGPCGAWLGHAPPACARRSLRPPTLSAFLLLPYFEQIPAGPDSFLSVSYLKSTLILMWTAVPVEQ